MSVEIIALFADWGPAVEAYRASGTDFYWDPFQRGEEPSFAEVHDLGGFKRFLRTESFYLDLEEKLAAADRERVEPFMRLIGAYSSPEDWKGYPADDIVTDSDGPTPEDHMFSMRPAKVVHALEVAEGIPWQAIEAACERLDLASGRNDVWTIGSYDEFAWILSTYIDWMKRAAEGGRGLIVLASI
ncbi:hypothetical protein [Glycomyces sp. NPDC048151]|uniref:hypothetical protein n=1 Tax=Glycomyces sp. NPDC048151 TaxID=3364002 RepID=UPI003718D352